MEIARGNLHLRHATNKENRHHDYSKPLLERHHSKGASTRETSKSAGDVMGAMKHLIRTVLEKKDEQVTRVSCYRVLRKYALNKLEIRRLEAELGVAKLRRGEHEEQLKAKDEEIELKEGLLREVNYMVDELEQLSVKQMEHFHSAMEKKNEELMLQASELHIRKNQVAEMEMQVQRLRSQKTAHAVAIQAMHSVLLQERDARIAELEKHIEEMSPVVTTHLRPVNYHVVEHEKQVVKEEQAKDEEEEVSKLDEAKKTAATIETGSQVSSVRAFASAFEKQQATPKTPKKRSVAEELAELRAGNQAKTPEASGKAAATQTPTSFQESTVVVAVPAIPIPVPFPQNDDKKRRELEKSLERAEALLKERDAVILDIQKDMENKRDHMPTADETSVPEGSTDKVATLELELATTRNELEEMRATVGRDDLQTELANTKKELGETKQKVAMLERYMIEDLEPPEDVVRAAAASQGVAVNVPDRHAEEIERENETMKAELADLRKKLFMAEAVVSNQEKSQKVARARVSELSNVAKVKSDTDAKKRLYEKSIECAELTATQEQLQQELRESHGEVKKLQQQVEMTQRLVDELSHAWDKAASSDENISRLHRERDESLSKLAVLSIELADCRTELDTVKEQLKAETKRNNEIVAQYDLDRSDKSAGSFARLSLASLYHRRQDSSDDEHLSGSDRSDLSLSPGRGRRGGTETPEEKEIGRLTRKLSDLEGQNAAYEATVAALRNELELIEKEGN